MKNIFFLLVVALNMSITSAQKLHYTASETRMLMGCKFEITIVDETMEKAQLRVEEAIAEIQRLERMISSWDENSETSKINRNAGIAPVKVSPELFGLIKRAKEISKLTEGAFDPTYASLDNIWKFDGSMRQLPSENAIKQSIASIGHEKIVLNEEEHTVFLSEPGMKLGFGAIGKGFAADHVKKQMMNMGVPGGLINASGDLTTWGTQQSGKKWIIGISNPKDKKRVFAWLPIVESSVATSGNYEKYIIYKGEKYSHIIDPRTGMPVRGTSSVSIFAKSAELSDALATAVFIMGIDAGIYLINQLPEVEAIMISEAGEIIKTNGIETQKIANVTIE